MSNITYPRSIIVSGLKAKWARLGGETAPTDNFGNQRWSVLVQTNDPAKAKELTDLGLKAKEEMEDGKKVFSIQLKRKGMKADGTPMKAPNIVNSKLESIDGSSIGNGSTVNVNLWQYEYNAFGNSGISTQLSGVQVTDHVVFEKTASGSGFEVVGEKVAAEDNEPKMPF